MLWRRPPCRVTGAAGAAGATRGGHHRIPHGIYPRDRGRHRAGYRIQVRGRGEGPIALGEVPDGAVVGDTHPMASGALLLAVPPLDQEHPALGGAGPGLRGGGPATADGHGTQVPEGRQQRGHLSGLRATPPVEAGGPLERGCRAIPPAEGLVERGPRHRQALVDALQGRQPPLEVRPRSRLVQEAPHEDVLQAEEDGG